MAETNALYVAAHTGDFAAVRHLAGSRDLDAGSGELGWTPLLAAAAQGHTDVVRWLLDAGARPDIVAGDGDSALALAVDRGHSGVVRLLTADDRVDVNLRDSWGWTPLMRAALSGHDEIAGLLLEQPDIAPNMADVDGRTPLIWAASAGHTATARRLARDPRVATSPPAADGVTAADAARDAGLIELASDLDQQASAEDPVPIVTPAEDTAEQPPPASPPRSPPIREPRREHRDG